MHKGLNIGRHYTISSAIRKTEKGKQFVHTFGDFVLCKGVNIYSVNLDREATFLTPFWSRPIPAAPLLWGPVSDLGVPKPSFHLPWPAADIDLF